MPAGSRRPGRRRTGRRLGRDRGDQQLAARCRGGMHRDVTGLGGGGDELLVPPAAPRCAQHLGQLAGPRAVRPERGPGHHIEGRLPGNPGRQRGSQHQQHLRRQINRKLADHPAGAAVRPVIQRRLARQLARLRPGWQPGQPPRQPVGAGPGTPPHTSRRRQLPVRDPEQHPGHRSRLIQVTADNLSQLGPRVPAAGRPAQRQQQPRPQRGSNMMALTSHPVQPARIPRNRCRHIRQHHPPSLPQNQAPHPHPAPRPEQR